MKFEMDKLKREIDDYEKSIQSSRQEVMGKSPVEDRKIGFGTAQFLNRYKLLICQFFPHRISDVLPFHRVAFRKIGMKLIILENMRVHILVINSKRLMIRVNGMRL